jgi:hypothetical protein
MGLVRSFSIRSWNMRYHLKAEILTYNHVQFWSIEYRNRTRGHVPYFHFSANRILSFRTYFLRSAVFVSTNDSLPGRWEKNGRHQKDCRNGHLFRSATRITMHRFLITLRADEWIADIRRFARNAKNFKFNGGNVKNSYSLAGWPPIRVL